MTDDTQRRVQPIEHFSLTHTGGLIRVLSDERGERETSMCCWRDCDATPDFELATPHGHWDICIRHIDHAITDLPSEWLDQWRWREHEHVVPDPLDPDDIPF